MDKKAVCVFYKSLLENNFLPYWSQFEDTQQGGILNCINNYGDQLLSENKFTWSQGRWLWILGRLYALQKKGAMANLDTRQLERWMESTWNFIVQHSIYGDNLCCYLLDRDGTRLKDAATNRYDASIYADCFALIGMAQYVKVTNRADREPVVTALYQSIVRRIEAKTFLTEPYPIPDGYMIHGIPMILVNTVHEYILMKRALGLDTAAEMAYGLSKAHFILHDLYDDGLIREHKSTPENAEARMLDRHINPGHTLEDLWFLTEFLEDAGELSQYLNCICEIAKRTFALGWDKQYGGLLRFVDKDGTRPHGQLLGSAPCAYEQLMLDTWDMKLWWPHSEILYVFLLLYDRSGDEQMLKLYEQSERYVFETFPNEKLGEWIQIRSRDGSPEEKLVALPVKDPFHIMRNFIKIVELTH